MGFYTLSLKWHSTEKYVLCVTEWCLGSATPESAYHSCLSNQTLFQFVQICAAIYWIYQILRYHVRLIFLFPVQQYVLFTRAYIGFCLFFVAINFLFPLCVSVCVDHNAFTTESHFWLFRDRNTILKSGFYDRRLMEMLDWAGGCTGHMLWLHLVV